jgi:hypothetical protein
MSASPAVSLHTTQLGRDEVECLLMERLCRRVVPSALRALVIACVLGACPTGMAAPTTHEAKTVESARSLFYRALALQDQGRWAEALELLEKVAETRESAQVRFNIAFNQEHLGRLAAAAQGYEKAIALAKQSGADNVTRAAYDRLGRLSSRVARLVLRPVGDGVSVTVDGVELGPAEWGRAIPVEVGDHTIRAHAVGYKPYRVSVSLPGGETRELRLELEPIREERPTEVAPEAPRAVEPAGPATKARRAAPGRNRASKSNTLPYLAGGAAVLSVATAGVFYALRKDALETMRERCKSGRCPDDLRSTDERGALYTSVANVALATGVGLAGVSAGLFISNLGSGDERGREVGVAVSTGF